MMYTQEEAEPEYKPRVAVSDFKVYLDGDYAGQIAVYEKLWMRMLPLTLQAKHLRALADKLDELNKEAQP